MTFEQAVRVMVGETVRELPGFGTFFLAMLVLIMLVTMAVYSCELMVRALYLAIFPAVDDPGEVVDQDEFDSTAMECDDVEPAREVGSTDRGRPGRESISARPSRRHDRR